QLAPDEGRKTGQWTWKRVTVDTAYLDFTALLGKARDSVAYACTHVYSETGGPFRVNLTCPGPSRAYVNGKAAPPFGTRLNLVLAKGWNRILLKVAPGEEDWFAVPVFHACGTPECEEAGIAWRTPLPGVAPAFYGGGTGVGAPVIVGDRLYLLSEPNDLICINKTDGKVLWVRRQSYFEAATDAERQHPAWKDAEAVVARIDALTAAFVAGTASAAQLQEKAALEKDLQNQMERVDPEKYRREPTPDVGFSGFTPVTDGRSIYVWSASGVTACYDLDGNRRWIRVDRLPAVEHGFSSSPLLVDGKLVAFMRDLLAFDAATGRLAWQIPVADRSGLNPGNFFHASPIAVAIGGTPVIVLGNGSLVWAADGKVLGASPKATRQSVASPVVDGRTLYVLSSGSMQLFIHPLPDALADPLKLPERAVDVKTAPFPTYYLPWHLASPVIHEGLAYLVNNSGVLTVVDVEAGRIVYQKMLDLDTCQSANEGAARGIGASPALAGGYLYVLGNNGAALVIQPGRVYKQIAKNKLESVVMAGHWAERQERFVANPVFEGKRLYIRGEGNLYAIGPR
ncbi:MAG: PQQ-binding-like beta-propeller repeat protein, partial [Planctomycetota bacterium]|nr:PQQ-binding-like beta-propeller repeat protein [Planctomycetota bacterium]